MNPDFTFLDEVRFCEMRVATGPGYSQKKLARVLREMHQAAGEKRVELQIVTESSDWTTTGCELRWRYEDEPRSVYRGEPYQFIQQLGGRTLPARSWW